MLFNFEADVTGPSADGKGNPVPPPSLYTLLKPGPVAGEEGIAGGVLPLPHEDDDDQGDEEGREADDDGHAFRRQAQSRGDPPRC